MASTITADIAELQGVNASVTGIVTAPTSYPGALNDVDLPCAIVWPGSAYWSRPSIGDLQRQDRTYLVRVYVCAISQDTLDNAIQRSITLLDAFGRAYIAACADASLTLHLKANEQGIRDGGIQVLSYAGNDYHGFEFQVDTHTKVST